jgi:hypothetical protein
MHSESTHQRHTLNSVTAKPFPRHVLGPSLKLRICLYDFISFALMSASGSSHLSGRYISASGPQNDSILLIAAIGTEVEVPLAIKTFSIVWPEAAMMGLLRGTISSSFACHNQGTLMNTYRNLGTEMEVVLDLRRERCRAKQGRVSASRG